MIKKYVPMTEASCYILLSVTKEAKHGYAIMQHIKKMTSGSVTIGNGTLYGSLSKMQQDGLLEVFIDNDKKNYKITDLGEDILRVEKKRLENMLHNFKEE